MCKTFLILFPYYAYVFLAVSLLRVFPPTVPCELNVVVAHPPLSDHRTQRSMW